MSLLNTSYSRCIEPTCTNLPTVVIKGIGHARGSVDQFTIQALSCATKEHIDMGYNLVQKTIDPHTPEITENPPRWLLERQKKEFTGQKKERNLGDSLGKNSLIGEYVGIQGIRIGRLRKKEK